MPGGAMAALAGDSGTGIHAFPQALQVHGAERTIVQPISSSTRLAPDHASMVGTHRPPKPDITQCAHHLDHRHVPECRRMGGLVELTIAGRSHIAAVHEMDTR